MFTPDHIPASDFLRAGPIPVVESFAATFTISLTLESLRVGACPADHRTHDGVVAQEAMALLLHPMAVLIH